MKSYKSKKRIVLWVCDKTDCQTPNTREIPMNTVIYDDICDFCHRQIHEPLTSDIENKGKNERKKQ